MKLSRTVGTCLSAATLIVAFAAPSTRDLSAQTGLKVYISADMEGVTGAVSGEQLGPTGFEYGRFRQFLTDEVNTAIAAARRAGATEIVVSDSHGNGQNLLIDQLPDDILIVRSWPRPLMMMEGIDASFDAAMFIGYHASTANTSGVRAHTISSANLTSVKLNGIEMTEGSINAAIAGHFDVPIVMISGDDAAVAEVQSVVGDIEGAVVKWSLGFHSALTMTPARGNEVIAERVTAALGRLDDFSPYEVGDRPTLDISFKNYMPAEVIAYLPNVERVDSHTVRFQGRDMVEISKFIEFVTTYQVNLTP